MEEEACGRPNPLLQFLYLGLVLGGQVLPEETMIYELELPPSSEEEPVVFELLVEYAEELQKKGCGRFPRPSRVDGWAAPVQGRLQALPGSGV